MNLVQLLFYILIWIKIDMLYFMNWVTNVLVFLFHWFRIHLLFSFASIKIICLNFFNLFKIVLNRLKTINHKYNILKKACKSLILFGLVYHLTDLTKDYLNYKQVIELKLKVDNKIKMKMVSYTICMNNSHRYSGADDDFLQKINKLKIKITNYLTRKNESYRFNGIFKELLKDWRIKNVLNIEANDFYINPDFERNLIIYYRHIKDGFYLTFHPEGENKFIESFFSNSYKRWKIIIHQSKTYSHFEIHNRYNLKLFEVYNPQIEVVKVDYLPFPYSTDCIEYSDKQKKPILAKISN